MNVFYHEVLIGKCDADYLMTICAGNTWPKTTTHYNWVEHQFYDPPCIEADF
jgi:hypothetical protein